MKRIGLISDTHGFLDPAVFRYFDSCDEIWHAGDIGTAAVADQLADFRPFKAVYGNIDGGELRRMFSADLRFTCDGVDVLMTHIGGYPGRYSFHAQELIKDNPPKLFICGHSHILKVIPDKRFGLLHINPGAAGIHGFHHKKTIVRFTVNEGKISDLEVIELGLRGSINDVTKS